MDNIRNFTNNFHFPGHVWCFSPWQLRRITSLLIPSQSPLCGLDQTTLTLSWHYGTSHLTKFSNSFKTLPFIAFFCLRNTNKLPCHTSSRSTWVWCKVPDFELAQQGEFQQAVQVWLLREHTSGFQPVPFLNSPPEASSLPPLYLENSYPFFQDLAQSPMPAKSLSRWLQSIHLSRDEF